MNKMKIVCFMVCAVICIGISTHPAKADQNLHTLTATLNDCWCDYYEITDDWLCWANFSIAAPYPHFSSTNQTTVLTEIEGQALGQCAEIKGLSSAQSTVSSVNSVKSLWSEVNESSTDLLELLYIKNKVNQTTTYTPKTVQMLFWVEAAGLDYVHGVLRSPIKGYYLIEM